MTQRAESGGYDRREFLASPAGLGMGALGLAGRDVLAAESPDSSQVVTGKNAKLVVIKGTGHLFMRTQFKEVSEAIKGFLDG